MYLFNFYWLGLGWGGGFVTCFAGHSSVDEGNRYLPIQFASFSVFTLTQCLFDRRHVLVRCRLALRAASTCCWGPCKRIPNRSTFNNTHAQLWTCCVPTPPIRFVQFPLVFRPDSTVGCLYKMKHVFVCCTCFHGRPRLLPPRTLASHLSRWPYATICSRRSCKHGAHNL